jgi:1-phosphofructokinase family hexose kinase
LRFLTLTLHPAIDRVLRVKMLTPGQTFDAALELRVPSGKGVNTARSLSTLVKAPIAAAAWVGADEAAWFARETLRLSKVKSLLCPRRCATRLANTILEDSGRETHVKEAMERPDTGEQAALLEFWSKAVKPGDIVAVCGSAPSGTAATILRALFRIARERGAAAIVADTSGPALEIAAAASLDGIKGNAAEIGAWLKLSAPLDLEIIGHRHALSEALAQKGAPNSIVVTLGKDGALLVTPNSMLRAAPPSVEKSFIVTATGCGDAATAGWMWAIRDGCAPEETLRRIVACGTAKLASADPGKLDRRHVTAFLPQVNVSGWPR